MSSEPTNDATAADLADALARAWTRALGTEPDAGSDFFSCGGSSLAALEMAAAVAASLPGFVDLDLVVASSLFEHPGFAMLVQTVLDTYGLER